jgi:hypothetical protein
LLTPQHHAGHDVVLTDRIGHCLVHTDSTSQLSTFLQRGSRKNITCLTGMYSNTGGVLIKQAMDDIELMAQGFKGL